MIENSDPSGERQFTPSPQETATGGPALAFRALLENGQVSRWRLGLGFLLHSAVVSALFLLPLLRSEPINGRAGTPEPPTYVFPAIKPPTPSGDLTSAGGGGPTPGGSKQPPNVASITDIKILPPGPPRLPEGWPVDEAGTGPFIPTLPPGSGGWSPSGTGSQGGSSAPPVSGDAPIRLSQGVDPPRLLRRVEPVYPSLARMAGIQGTVVLDGVLGTDGRVRQIEVKAGPVLLHRAAREAVDQWLYEPAHLNNQPVAVFFRIEVKFVLNR